MAKSPLAGRTWPATEARARHLARARLCERQQRAGCRGIVATAAASPVSERSLFGHIFAASYRGGARGADRSPFERRSVCGACRCRRGQVLCAVRRSTEGRHRMEKARADAAAASAGHLVARLLAVAAGRWRRPSPGVSAQDADGRWWEAIPGFGRPEGQPRRSLRRGAPRGPRRINDLRPDATPLRSEDMIEALEGAIQRYQAHRRQRRLADHPRHPHDPPRGQRRARAAAAPAADASAASWRAANRAFRLRLSATTSRRPCAASRTTTACASRAASTSRRCRR